ncbi:unnamed protein product [Adineta steineri]|uniref:Apple domain-containing protein n=1 Tax=Adineta steineri TaxID=433720 RepID=A0A813TFD8_9BILA|nr:unnamed protein product [Adineta steineri]
MTTIYFVSFLIISVVNADIYLHFPPGSNNRVNEQTANRQNAQNNNKGGYNVPDATSAAYGTNASLQYYLQLHSDIILNSTASHYQEKSSLLEIVSNLMVEKWNNQTFYDNYFNICQPSVCTATYVSQGNIVYIITTTIGLIGGLTKVYKFVVPIFIMIIIHPVGLHKLLSNYEYMNSSIVAFALIGIVIINSINAARLYYDNSDDESLYTRLFAIKRLVYKNKGTTDRCTEIVKGRNYLGGDMVMDREGQLQSPAACAALCEVYLYCIYWTFDTVDGRCYLKDKSVQTLTKTTTYSGSCTPNT